MSDPFFAPVRKTGGDRGGRQGGRGGRGGRGGSRGGRGSSSSGQTRAINPAPKLDTGKKNRATTSLAGKRKHRGDSSDEETSGKATRRGGSGRKGAVEDDDEGGDEIGAGGIDDMDLEFGISEDDSEDETLATETAAQKRLRLAKNYIDTLQHAGEDEIGFDAEDIDRDNIADRLKQDALEIQGRLHRHLSETFQFPLPNLDTAITACRGHHLSVTSVAATENGLYAYSGSKDGSIIKWDLKTGKKICLFPGGRKGVEDFKGHTDHVICLAVSSDNQFLASGGKDKKINIWSVQENKWLHCFKQQHKDTITGMSFRKGQNNQLYTVSSDRTVKLWNVDEMSYIETLFGHQDSITAVDSLAKEHCVSTGGRDRTVRLWKIVEESQLVFRGGGFIRPKKLNKDAADTEGTPKVVATPGPDGGFVMKEKKDPSFLEGSMDCLAMIDEENFLTGGDSGTISLWNINKKKAVFSMPLAHGYHTQDLDYSNGESQPGGGVETPYWITSLASLRYSDMFVSGSWDGTIRVWQIGKNIKNFSLLSTIPMVGVINDLQIYQPTLSKKTLLVAAVGQEHKLGRWLRIKEGRNGLRIIELSAKSKQAAPEEDKEDEEEDEE
ncbi:pre-rRNA processing protein [Mortierella claussenii]|nr:pre-rRNA processing protein [Mortierella claussenii]